MSLAVINLYTVPPYNSGSTGIPANTNIPSQWVGITDYVKVIGVIAGADAPGTLYLEQSNDQATVINTNSVDYTSTEQITANAVANYARVRAVTGSSVTNAGLLTLDGVAASFQNMGNADATSLTSSLLTMTGPVVGFEDKGGQVFNVKSYGAKGNGTTDDTAALQAAINDAVAVNGILLFPPSITPYLHATPLTVGGNLTVFAYGATLKWTGASTTSQTIYNTVSGYFNWFGGTYDGNGTPQTLWGVGTQGVGVNVTGCIVEDLTFINVYSGAWSMQAISSSGTNYNTHVRWRNLGVIKLTTGNAADMLELVGSDVEADVWGVPNGTNAVLITSAWVKGAKIRARTLSAELTPSAENGILLQAFTSNGPAPYFDEVELESNGQIQLTDGNLTALTQVSNTILIKPVQSAVVQIGSSIYDKWESVKVEGTLNPVSSQGAALQLFNAGSVTLDVTIDCVGITTQIGQVISLNASGIVNRIYFESLKLKNLAAGALGNSLIYGGSGFTNSIFTIDKGDITENSGSLAQSFIFGGVKPGTTLLRIKDWIGYNPAGPQTAPAIPASGTALTNPFPFDCTVYISGGTVTEIAIGGTSTGLTSGAIFIAAGETITLTYSATPTWVWIGN